MKQGYIIHSERDCVHTCSNCNGRIELFYPDGTEVVTLPYCPYCGCSLGKKSEVNIPFMTSPIGDLPINSEGLRKTIDKIVELSELQKEIERWKEEYSWLDCKCQALQKQVDELTEEVRRKTEILSGTYANFVRSENKNTELQKQIEAWKLKAKELEEAWEISSKNEVELAKSNDSKLVKILKLQEQVDELMEKNKNLKYSFDTANRYIRKLAESCETNCKKFNGITTQQAAKDMAKKIYDELKSEVISVDIPRGGEPAEEDCEAVLWWKIEQILRKKAQVE